MARNGKRRLLAEMNVVPYIDVMLVLVVILMVAAPYVNPSIVDLPKVNKAARTPDKVVEVIISPDGKLQIRDTAKKLTPVDFPQLVSTVESMQTDGNQVPVVIAADKTVAYEKVIDVMRNLQKANITRIGLSLQLEGSGASNGRLISESSESALRRSGLLGHGFCARFNRPRASFCAALRFHAMEIGADRPRLCRTVERRHAGSRSPGRDATGTAA